MVYKKNKAIAIVIAFVFCLSFLAPAMISPSVAQAADAIEYSYVGSGQFKTSDTAQSIGKIVVNVDDVKVLNTYAEGGNYLSVNLPEGMTFDPPAADLVEAGVKVNVDDFSTYPPNLSSDLRTLNLKVSRVISGKSAWWAKRPPMGGFSGTAGWASRFRMAQAQ
jgi:hypothetical protein